jgi:hypothetical protein
VSQIYNNFLILMGAQVFPILWHPLSANKMFKKFWDNYISYM